MVRNLRCEYRTNPLGTDVVQPRLSWEIDDARRGAAQSAYQILAASSPEALAAGEGDLWDTGRVESDETIHIAYAGTPLTSRARCHWKVRVWDQQGQASDWSEPALWTMGLLTPEDVTAQWIGVAETGDLRFGLDRCPWLCFPERDIRNLSELPCETRRLRGAATVPEDTPLDDATFLLATDSTFVLFVNGREAARAEGGAEQWKETWALDVGALLVEGRNVFALEVEKLADTLGGVAGKLLVGEHEFPMGPGYRAATEAAQGWEQVDFDDSAWPAASFFLCRADEPWRVPGAPDAGLLPCFRKEFVVEQPIRRATAHLSALGVTELHINGQRVGEDYFTPDWTDYNARVTYSTYDVTDLVREGGNALGAILGDGWYAGPIGWQLDRQLYGPRPKVLAQLEVELADGAVQTVGTDSTWRTMYGPHCEGEFLAGEVYDARLEMPGWTESDFDDHLWGAVAESAPERLEAFAGVPVQETGTLRPLSVSEPAPGRYVFDMGQNFAGIVRLKVSGPAGTAVTLACAEMLNPDGTLYETNLRSARAHDTYILKGEGEEVWQPSFTFHGFRYVEVVGYPGEPGLDAVTGIALNSTTPLVGAFECSSPMVNQLYSNIVWTQRANFISVPTDCPQRDERMGWTGDAQVFVRAACWNADVASFFTKWLVDLADAQSPAGAFPDVAPRTTAADGEGTAAWGDAGTVCPWTIYQFYDDVRLLERHYDGMTRWVEYCKGTTEGLLRPAAGFGDWLSIGADTPKDVLATAFFAHSTRLTAQAAAVLGREEDAVKYEQLFQDTKAAFNGAYVHEDGSIEGDTQTVYVLALQFDLLSDELRVEAARRLAADVEERGHLSTGFIGTSYLLPVLSAVGHTPLAWRLLLNETFPSWGYSIRHGATSIWERWDGWTAEKGFQTPGMNSFAHYAFGAVAQWMFETAAGITSDGPGFKRIRIRPEPRGGLSWVKASHHSIRGPIAVEWRVVSGRFVLSVSIPANTTATVHVPCADPSRVAENGRPAAKAEGVTPLPPEPGHAVFEVASGSYSFETIGQDGAEPSCNLD